jgi:hypothetical protein
MLPTDGVVLVSNICSHQRLIQRIIRIASMTIISDAGGEAGPSEGKNGWRSDEPLAV